MGGIVCHIHRNAILRYESVPTGRHEIKEFDAQLRQLFGQQSIAEAVEAAGTYVRVCDLLAKDQWTQAERTELYELVESLYEEYEQNSST